MDSLYVMIIVFTFLLIFLHYREKKYSREPFYNKDNNSINNIEDNSINNISSVNFNKKLDFSDFSVDGKQPFMQCHMCNIDFDCTNYPYNVDEANMSVCTQCTNSLDSYIKPMVLAKSAGRPRQCRELY